MLIRSASFRSLKHARHMGRKLLAMVLAEVMAITSVVTLAAGAGLPLGHNGNEVVVLSQLPSLLNPQLNSSQNQTPASHSPAGPVKLASLTIPKRVPAPVRPMVQASNSAAGIAVSVGFADNSSASANFPVPWQGAANTVFLGGGTAFRAGAIRIDNTGASSISIDKVTVDLGRPGPSFQLWSNFTIPGNSSAILTQTADNNFNTSAASPLAGCGVALAANETRIPKITVTIAGTDNSFSDTAHVLDTGGFDSSCRGNQSLAWRPAGTTGPERPSAALHLASENAPHDVGTQTTFTATVTDAADQPLANASVLLNLISGPNSGKSFGGATDSNGSADLQYTSSAQGVDSAQAVIANASGGNLTSETAQTTWISADACVAPPTSAGTTKLIYVGQTSGSFGDQLRVAALLTNGTGQPLASRPVTLTIGGHSSVASTDANGVAAATVTPDIGQTSVSASFAGDQNFSAAQLSTSITIQSRATLLRYTGNSLLGSTGPQPVSAVLTDSLGQAPIAGRNVTFAVGTTQVTAVTDAKGSASATITFPATQSSGPAQLAISFAGDQDYKASSRVVPIQIYLTTSFVVWGGNAGGLKIGQDVNFWGNQWSKQITSGNFASSSAFKGFADPVGLIQQCQPNATNSTVAPGCWQSKTGQSSPPPISLPAYIQVMIATAGEVDSTGLVFGNIACPAVLKVDANPPYGQDPGQPGFGVITAVNGDCAGVFPKPAVLTAKQTQLTPVLPSQQITVNATIRNSGATDATNGLLAESFDGLAPATASQTFATIPAGQSVSASFPAGVPAVASRQSSESSSDYETRLAGLDGRFFTSSAELTFTDVFQQLYQPLDFSSFSTLQIPRLTVAISGPGCIVPGAQVPYQVGINNIGGGTAASGSAAVTLPDGTTQTLVVPQVLSAASFAGIVQWQAPVIQAKGPTETTAAYLARLAAADNVTVSPTTASVTWLDSLHNSYGAVDQQFSSVKQRLPILAVTPGAPATVLPNQAATMNFAVTNTGGGNAVQANIAVTRPGAANIVVPAFSLPAGQSASVSGILRLPAIPTEGPQESDAQYVLRLQALDNQKVSLDGTLSWTDKSGNLYGPTSNPFSTTEILPILTMAVTAPATAKPGDVLAYTVVLQNVGHGDAAAINITFTLPDGSVQHPFAGSGLVAGGTAQTTVSFTIPSSQPAGTLTAKARLGWTDAAGNIYGFENATASTSVVASAPTITDFTPKNGPTGTAVSIIGTNLSSTAGPTTVTFAGPNNTQVAAKINFASATQLAVVVPDTAVTGVITVTTPTGSVSTAVPFTVGPRQDFQVTLSPTTATVPQGSSTAFIVAVTSPQTSFTQLANLSVAGLPQGVAAGFNPAQITAGASSALSVDLSATNLQPGLYSFTVHATTTIDGKQQDRTAIGKLNVIASGQTTLAGQVLSTSNEPIVGASVSLDGQTVLTDAAGRFLLVGVQAGTNRPLSVDGHTAFSPNATFPLIFEPATIIAGRANIIQRPFNLPPIDTSQEVTIDPTRDTVAGNAAVQNLQMTIPKGANLRTLDGTLVTRTSITPLAPDRTPAPLPADVGTNIVYTSQPGGAITDIPIPVVYPNLAELDPGTEVELYAFDHAHVNWFVYGIGKVSADGKTIAPEIDPTTGKPYGLKDFSWHFPNAAPNGNPGDPDEPCCRTDNPVDLSTGVKIEKETDVSFGGARGGLAFTRVYTSDKAQSCDSCPFGRGWTHNWDIRLTGSFIPGGAGRVAFSEQVTGHLFSSSGVTSTGSAVFKSTGTVSQLGDSVLSDAGGNLQYQKADGTILRFNSLGRLISQTDRNGNVTALTYSGNNLTQITDAVGRSLTFTYDGSNRIISMTDPLGRTWHYTYEGTPGVAGVPGLTTVTDPAGNVTKYSYVTGGRLASIVDARGNTVKQLTYDTNGRVISEAFADGGTEQYNYALSGVVVTATTATDAVGRTTSRRFSTSGYVLGQTDASGQTTTVTRNLSTNTPTATFGAGGKLDKSRQFDDRGNVVVETDRLGFSTQVEFEPVFNKPIKVTDKLGNVSKYQYDGKGNLTASINPLNQQTSYSYDSFGELTSVTDALGHTVHYEYDPNGNLSAVVDALGNRTAIKADILGHVQEVTDPSVRKTQWTYDLLDRITSTTNPAGNSTTFKYDEVGNLIAVTDSFTKQWKFTYDNKNRRIAQQDPLGNVTKFQYDIADQVIAISTPQGRITSYQYDPRGRIAKMIAPDQATVSYEYDDAGNLIKFSDQKNNAYNYAYDDVRRPIQRTDSLGQTFTSQYNAQGIVRVAVDRLGRSTTYSYDALMRPSVLTYPDATVTYTYDDAGRLSRIDDTESGSIAWTYDDANRVLSETNRYGAIQYTYNASGQRDSAVIGNTRIDYRYDFAGRLTDIAANGMAFHYDFDAASRPVTLSRAGGPVTTYAYDDANRMSHVTHTGSSGGVIDDFNYTFTPDGQVASIGSAASSIALPASRNAAVANGVNELPSIDSISYSFDSRGQLLSENNGTNNTNYQFDSRGRLTSVTLPDRRVVAYQYDALGRRISTSVDGHTTGYLYTGMNVSADVAQDGSMTVYVNGPGIDNQLAQIGPTGSFYLLKDRMGSVTDVTDLAGNVMEHRAYEPFGASTPLNLSRFGFSGREFDNATGLYFLRARYYSPFQQRFISEDPTGFDGSDSNLYAYAGNDPVNNSDVFGLWSPGAHDALIQHALGPCGVPDFIIKQLQEDSREWDKMSQGPDQSNFHSMAMPNQTPQQAIDGRNQIIADYMEKSQYWYSQGRDQDAYFDMAIAIHAIMDMTSPAHTDPQGNPYTWCGKRGCPGDSTLGSIFKLRRNNARKHSPTDIPGDGIENLPYLNKHPQYYEPNDEGIRLVYEFMTGKPLNCDKCKKQ